MDRIREANHLCLRVRVVAQLVVILLAKQIGDEVGEDEGKRAPQRREGRVHNEEPIEPLLPIIRGLRQYLARPVNYMHTCRAVARLRLYLRNRWRARSDSGAQAAVAAHRDRRSS